MNKKANRFIIFYLFSISFMSTFISFASAESIEYEWDKSDIYASNLKISIPERDGIKIVMGGKSVDRVVNQGSKRIDDDTVLFKAKVYCTVSFTWYSAYTQDNTYKSKTTATKTHKWLDLWASADPSIPLLYPGKRYSYDANFKQYQFTDLKAKGTDYTYPINAEIVDLNARTLDFGNQVYNCTGKTFVGSVSQITVLESKHREVGAYENIYAGNSEVKLTATDVSKETPSSEAKEGQSSLIAAISNANLGISQGSIYSATVQQGSVIKPAVGQDVTSGVFIRLIPDVKHHLQTMNIRYQKLTVDTSTGFLGLNPAGVVAKYSGPVSQKSVVRTVGFMEKDYAIDVKFQVEVDVSATAKIDLVHSGDTSDLEDIVQHAEDNMIDIGISGDTGVDIQVDSSDPVTEFLRKLKGPIILVLIIGGILALAYFLVPAYLQKKATEKGMKAAINNVPYRDPRDYPRTNSREYSGNIRGNRYEQY